MKLQDGLKKSTNCYPDSPRNRDRTQIKSEIIKETTVNNYMPTNYITKKKWKQVPRNTTYQIEQ